MSQARKFRRSRPVLHQPEPKPLPRWARAVNWTFSKLAPSRQMFLIRVKMAVARWWVDPTVPPELLGRKGRYEYRPATIALTFELHADGAVAFKNRLGGPDEWVDDPHLVGLVHREYKRLVEHGRRLHQIR